MVNQCQSLDEQVAMAEKDVQAQNSINGYAAQFLKDGTWRSAGVFFTPYEADQWWEKQSSLARVWYVHVGRRTILRNAK